VPPADSVAAAARARLGPERFAAAWAAGRALTEAEAVALARATTDTISGNGAAAPPEAGKPGRPAGAGLPAPSTSFIGRELELAEVARLQGDLPAARAASEEARALEEGGAEARATADAVAALQEAPPRRHGREALPGGLTPREAEVLRHVAAGATDRQIAAALVVSEDTVGRHLTHIFRKLDVPSRAGASAFAVRHGLA
jgi:DNA-binding CsgD family transcriptional regulator